MAGASAHAAPSAAKLWNASDTSAADALGSTSWSVTNPECPLHEVRFRVMRQLPPPGPGQFDLGEAFAWIADLEVGEFGHDDTAHGLAYQLITANYVVDGDRIDMKGDGVAAHLYGVVDAPDHMTLTLDYATGTGAADSVPCLAQARRSLNSRQANVRPAPALAAL